MLKVGNRHWHTRIDSKTAAFHPNEKRNQFCSTRPVFLSWLWTWIFRLFEQSEQSSSAWHTKFHGISNIQTWMWSTLHSYGFYCKFYFMPINPFIHFPMAHRWSDRLSFFQVIFLCFWFLPHSFQPFHKSLGSLPKTAPCPEAAAQATTPAAAANQAADHCKAFPKPLRAGFWLAAILTRSERGANEVRNQILGDWPLSLLTKSLLATRVRILFRTVKLKSFQRWSTRGNQAKQQLQVRARRQKRRQRASKGDRGETKGRKLGKQGGGEKFGRAQNGWDVGIQW